MNKPGKRENKGILLPCMESRNLGEISSWTVGRNVSDTLRLREQQDWSLRVGEKK